MSKNKQRDCDNNSRNGKPNNNRGGYSPDRGRSEKGQSNGNIPKSIGDINDLSHYVPTGSELLVQQLNTYSFDAFAGVEYDLGSLGFYTTQAYSHTAELNVANIMQICVNPCVSYTDPTTPQTAGINVAGLRNYAMFSAENGKNTQYQPQDITMLQLAVGQILAMFSFGARALGLARTYNYRNRSYPNGAIAAAGFTPANLTSSSYAANLAAYNAEVYKFNKIPIPKNVMYFDKCAKMFQNIYLDEDGSAMAQSYCMVPEYTWEFDDAYSSQGAGLRTVQVLNSTDSATGFKITTFAHYIQVLDSMIEALLTSSVFNFIYADILRLQKKSALELMQISELPYSYAVGPVKSEEISIWVNNAVILGLPSEMKTSPYTLLTGYTAMNDVIPDVNNNSVIYRPMFDFNQDMTSFKYLLNFKHDAPDIAEKVAATRLQAQFKTSAKQLTSSSGTFTRWVTDEMALCDWYVTNVRVASGNGMLKIEMNTNFIDRSAFSTNTGIHIMMKVIGAVSKFDWHPYFYFTDLADIAAGSDGLQSVLGDLQYYTSITYQQLYKMNDVALLGLTEIH